MNNYEIMQRSAAARFTSYDPGVLAAKTGVMLEGKHLFTHFLGERVRICTETGEMTLGGEPAGFSASLAVYDWLCDGKPDAVAAGEFAPVTSLPGVHVGGSGLSMCFPTLARAIEQNPEGFRDACSQMGGKAVELGDLGFQIPVFPGLDMQLKFYFADDEFPPTLTFLWDKHILNFVRYETVYYICGVLGDRLLKRL